MAVYQETVPSFLAPASRTARAWLTSPWARTSRVYRRDSDDITIMRGKAVLTLEPIVSGVKLRVADIFR